MRGDDPAQIRGRGPPQGSPPRAWGRPRHHRPGPASPRFTPTCVGTTSSSRAQQPGRPSVHPHVRGDDRCRHYRFCNGYGSPPRAWGRQAGGEAPAGGQRFTPTCVGTTARTRKECRDCTVHPHVRGDDGPAFILARSWAGSPPRAWGRRERDRAEAVAVRFTPTCVGTTRCSGLRVRSRSVHPHVRGDDLVLEGVALIDRGSPPRAWGRRSTGGAPKPVRRFTPTCVGTTSIVMSMIASGSVHPHVRGDDSSDLRIMASVPGSPPRAWGRPTDTAHRAHGRRFTPTCVGTTHLTWRRLGGDRFTPTCVGTTAPQRRPRTASAVHPHVRGDDIRQLHRYAEYGGSPPRAWGRRLLPRTSLEPSGSPPRAWGRRHLLSEPPREPRFTPTCVGTTLPMVFPSVGSIGSPPRAWGRHLRERVRPDACRFTPTCVGTTGVARAHRATSPVHPHVRGDDVPAARGASRAIGSPPRAWGRLPLPLGPLTSSRFTPTCVGTTTPSQTFGRGQTGSPPRAWGRRS